MNNYDSEAYDALEGALNGMKPGERRVINGQTWECDTINYVDVHQKINRRDRLRYFLGLPLSLDKKIALTYQQGQGSRS